MTAFRSDCVFEKMGDDDVNAGSVDDEVHVDDTKPDKDDMSTGLTGFALIISIASWFGTPTSRGQITFMGLSPTATPPKNIIPTGNELVSFLRVFKDETVFEGV